MNQRKHFRVWSRSRNWSCLKPHFFPWSWSRLNLVGVSSGTLTFWSRCRSRLKKWRFCNTVLFYTTNPNLLVVSFSDKVNPALGLHGVLVLPDDVELEEVVVGHLLTQATLRQAHLCQVITVHPDDNIEHQVRKSESKF